MAYAASVGATGRVPTSTPGGRGASSAIPCSPCASSGRQCSPCATCWPAYGLDPRRGPPAASTCSHDLRSRSTGAPRRPARHHGHAGGHDHAPRRRPWSELDLVTTDGSGRRSWPHPDGHALPRASTSTATTTRPRRRSRIARPALPEADEVDACVRHEIGAGAAHVYTECSRIWNPIHTDARTAAARRAARHHPARHRHPGPGRQPRPPGRLGARPDRRAAHRGPVRGRRGAARRPWSVRASSAAPTDGRRRSGSTRSGADGRPVLRRGLVVDRDRPHRTTTRG